MSYDDVAESFLHVIKTLDRNHILVHLAVDASPCDHVHTNMSEGNISLGF